MLSPVVLSSSESARVPKQIRMCSVTVIMAFSLTAMDPPLCLQCGNVNFGTDKTKQSILTELIILTGGYLEIMSTALTSSPPSLC